MEKRGLGDLVVVTILVLIALALIALIWAFLQNPLDRIESIEQRTSLTRIEVVPGSVFINETTSSISLTVRRVSGEDASGFYLILVDSSENQYAIRIIPAPRGFETQNVSTNYLASGISTPIKIIIVPFFLVNGNEILGLERSEYIISSIFTLTPEGGNQDSLGFCGDGIMRVPNDNGELEECDDGNTNSGDGCDSSCNLELQSLSWNLIANSGPANQMRTKSVEVNFEESQYARWYKIDRVTDESGQTLHGDTSYPRYFHSHDIGFSFTSGFGGTGVFYLKGSAWTAPENEGGVKVADYPEVKTIYYNHSYQRLQHTLNVEFFPEKGYARIHAIPSDPVLGEESKLWSWKYAEPTGDSYSNGMPRFNLLSTTWQTDTPYFDVPITQPGVNYYVLERVWNGAYGFNQLHLITMGINSFGGEFVNIPGSGNVGVPTAIIVPYEDGTIPQVAPGFTGQVFVTSPIPGDVRSALLKDEIIIFNGAFISFLLETDSRYAELQVPQGVNLLDFTDPARGYTVTDVSSEVVDGSLPAGYVRYKLNKNNPNNAWMYRNRGLKVFFEITDDSLIGTSYPLYIRLFNEPEDSQRADNWQSVSAKFVDLPSVQLPQRLVTSYTWTSPQGMFMTSPTNPEEVSFFPLYRALGLNIVPRNGGRYVSPDSPGYYILPDERVGPEWEGMLYGPQFSSFMGTPYYGDSIQVVLKKPISFADTVDLSEFGLTSAEETEERSKLRRALEYREQVVGIYGNSVRLIDMAYDGVFYWRDMNEHGYLFNIVRPDYFFIDSESWPTWEQWLDTVQYSENANVKRNPGETDSNLAYRMVAEWAEGLEAVRVQNSPGAKIGFYGSHPIHNGGYYLFPWETFGRNNFMAQPVFYSADTMLEHYIRMLRKSRESLPRDYLIVPWLGFGVFGETESKRVFDVFAHTFINGANGFSIYSTGADVDDGGDLYYMAEVIGMVSPHEGIVMDGDLMYENLSDIENAYVSAIGLNGEYLVAVTPKNLSESVAFTFETPYSGSTRAIDLRHGSIFDFTGNVIQFDSNLPDSTILRVVNCNLHPLPCN